MPSANGYATALPNCFTAVKPSRLAVDTNVLLDIADEVDDVLDATDVIADSALTSQVRQSARKAIRLLRDTSRFRFLLELPFAPEKINELAGEFRRRQLLPKDEINDSLILAETVLLDCAILLTSDEHFRSIDHEQLTWLLTKYDLAAPVIATPREIVRKFFR